MRNGGARLIVVAAAVLVGVLVLIKGLPGSAGAVAPPGHTTPPSPGSSPSPSVTGTSSGAPTGSPGPARSPDQQGVTVAVFNASSTTGLAAATATVLQSKGYVIAGQPGNLPSSRITIIYYKDDQGKADAAHLQQILIKEAKLQKLPKNLSSQVNFPKSAILVVALGSDYAASHPIGG
jgi:LytR cell envelope-related transcriptional attenuator